MFDTLINQLGYDDPRRGRPHGPLYRLPRWRHLLSLPQERDDNNPDRDASASQAPRRTDHHTVVATKTAAFSRNRCFCFASGRKQVSRVPNQWKRLRCTQS